MALFLFLMVAKVFKPRDPLPCYFLRQGLGKVPRLACTCNSKGLGSQALTFLYLTCQLP